MLSLIFLCFSLVCFVFGAFWQPAPVRPNFTALGLAFYVLYVLVGTGGMAGLHH
jgi:hypothetical protein